MFKNDFPQFYSKIRLFITLFNLIKHYEMVFPSLSYILWYIHLNFITIAVNLQFLIMKRSFGGLSMYYMKNGHESRRRQPRYIGRSHIILFPAHACPTSFSYKCGQSPFAHTNYFHLNWKLLILYIIRYNIL